MERHFSATPHGERRTGRYDRRCGLDRRSGKDRRKEKKAAKTRAGAQRLPALAMILTLLRQIGLQENRRAGNDRRKNDRRAGLDRRNSDFKMALSADEISVLLGHL